MAACVISRASGTAVVESPFLGCRVCHQNLPCRLPAGLPRNRGIKPLKKIRYQLSAVELNL